MAERRSMIRSMPYRRLADRGEDVVGRIADIPRRAAARRDREPARGRGSTSSAKNVARARRTRARASHALEKKVDQLKLAASAGCAGRRAAKRHSHAAQRREADALGAATRSRRPAARPRAAGVVPGCSPSSSTGSGSARPTSTRRAAQQLGLRVRQVRAAVGLRQRQRRRSRFVRSPIRSTSKRPSSGSASGQIIIPPPR